MQPAVSFTKRDPFNENRAGGVITTVGHHYMNVFFEVTRFSNQAVFVYAVQLLIVWLKKKIVQLIASRLDAVYRLTI